MHFQILTLFPDLFEQFRKLGLVGRGVEQGLLKISTNKRARVRMYGDATKRTADLARAIGTDPSGDHGVLLDYANTATASGRLSQVSPHVDAHNLDTNPLNKTYLNITNYDATGNVVVAFLYVPTEVV